MSEPIFLACVRGKDSPRFKRAVFEEIFLPHCAHLKSYRDDPGSMDVEYPDGSRADISIHNRSEEEERARRLARPEDKLPEFPPGDPAFIEFLGFGHFGGDAFFRDLYALADRVGAMVYAGGKPSVIVTKESVLKEIPEDFLGMENARVVSNASELEEAVFAS